MKTVVVLFIGILLVDDKLLFWDRVNLGLIGEGLFSFFLELLTGIILEFDVLDNENVLCTF